MKLPRGMRAAIVIVAAIALQAAVIESLRSQGMLNQMIPWDECAYIYIGMANAFSIKAGMWSWVEYAHAPLALAWTTVAAMIEPLSASGPYLINGLYLAALFLFIDKKMRDCGALALTAFLAVVITTPYFVVFASHVKTDFVGGIFFFMLLATIFDERDDQDDGLLLPSILAIAIILAKPMAFYMPVLVCMGFVLAAFHDYLQGRATLPRALKHAGILCAVTIFAYAAIVLPNLTYFEQYIKQALSSRWSTDATLAQKMMFYLPFVPSTLNKPGPFWGNNYVGFLLVIATFAIGVLRHSDLKRLAITAACLVCMVVAVYIPIVTSPQIQWSFGAFFAGGILALMLFGFRVGQTTTTRVTTAVNIGIIVCGAAVFHVSTRYYEPWIHHNQKDVSQARAIVETFVDKMSPNLPANNGNRAIYMTFTGAIPKFDFAIRYYQQYRLPVTSIVEAYAVDESSVDQLSNYQFVVMIEHGEHVLTSASAYAQADTLQKSLRAAWNLEEISTMPFADARYVLYRVVSRKGN